MKSVSLRIRKCYFDQIVGGEKKVELRKLSPFWARRFAATTPPLIAVFVCGRRVHRRRILKVTIENTEKILGRSLSEQRQKDVPTELCYAIWLGEAIK